MTVNQLLTAARCTDLGHKLLPVYMLHNDVERTPESIRERFPFLVYA